MATGVGVPCHLKRIYTLQLLGETVPYVYKIQFLNCAIEIIYMLIMYFVSSISFGEKVC